MAESSKTPKSIVKDTALFIVALPVLIFIPFLMVLVTLVMPTLKMLGLVDRERPNKPN